MSQLERGACSHEVILVQNNTDVIPVDMKTSGESGRTNAKNDDEAAPSPDEKDGPEIKDDDSDSSASEQTKARLKDERDGSGDGGGYILKVSASDDSIEDSLFDPLQADPDCLLDSDGSEDCNAPPISTIEQTIIIDAACSYGGDDPDAEKGDDNETCSARERVVDKHWGSDPHILRMRDQLRQTGSGASCKEEHQRQGGQEKASSSCNSQKKTNQRPPIFLMPGLASTRLINWKFKSCPQSALLSDIKVQDNVWLNLNLWFQMSTIEAGCLRECLSLGWNQSDSDHAATGCKLRPDEGLDAISSLSPGSIGSQLLVGGTNTVYAWLTQWLADNLGYDVSNLLGLPYDWRLSPDKMEQRDGFLTLTRRRIEAVVQTNGKPGIMVAHSMGNVVFRYFLEWLRAQLRQEAYEQYRKHAARRAKVMSERAGGTDAEPSQPSSIMPGWMQGVVDDWWPVTAPGVAGSSAAAGDTTTATENKPQPATADDDSASGELDAKLLELAKIEGDEKWYEWIEKHIWTYVGLSAPLLGAVNALRAVISGENMGLPMTDETARHLELSFGSTHTVNPISSKAGFCDRWDNVDEWDEDPSQDELNAKKRHADSRLACLDDIQTEIEISADDASTDAGRQRRDPWENFPALKNLLHGRSDWDSDFPMVDIVKVSCQSSREKKKTCTENETIALGPFDAQSGRLFDMFNEVWKEQDEPLKIKRDQLKESFWDTPVKNILESPWDRPLIKHVVMAYGVDMPTEVGYSYHKQVDTSSTRPDSTTADDKKDSNQQQWDGIPNLVRVLWETAGGRIDQELMNEPGGGIAELLRWKKKRKRVPFVDGRHGHSGDGSCPYLSLSWAHTWLLHAVRALRHSGINQTVTSSSANPLDDIVISHRPKGAMEWEDGPPPERMIRVGDEPESEKDTGTSHPHGTKYKPEMLRYSSKGTSRTTGIEYTTTVIEAIGVEHKETTRNYDILAAVFTEALKYMHDDLDML